MMKSAPTSLSDGTVHLLLLLFGEPEEMFAPVFLKENYWCLVAMQEQPRQSALALHTWANFVRVIG